jgi:hypothetical protein
MYWQSTQAVLVLMLLLRDAGHSMQAQQYCKVNNFNTPDNENLHQFICITYVIKTSDESMRYYFPITYIAV